MSVRPVRRALAALLMLAGTVSPAPGAGPGNPEPGYAALQSLPALEGWWRLIPVPPAVPPAIPGLPPVIAQTLKPMRPEIVARFVEASRRGGGRPAAGGDRGYCTPLNFAGLTGQVITPGPDGILPVSFEILLNPGRVTIADELGIVRRLYLRDTLPADALDESSTGTSIAHWEGRELVVQTTGLARNARPIAPIAGIVLGRHARVDERISLVEPEVLQIVATVTAPELYAAPVTTISRYRRNPGHTFTELVVCVENDRAFDRASGSERFDATPPDDLPPPPSN